MEPEHFDIVVIGAGPAGSMAALSASKAGKRVCLIDRKAVIGSPVRCGEGIGYKGLSLSTDARPEWIKNRISHSVMVSPGGIQVELRNVEESYILDRLRMDADLANDAENAGAVVFKSTPITLIEQITGNRYLCTGPVRSVTGTCIILADGVESKLARNLGWNTALEMHEIETCAFAHVISPFIKRDTCYFFTGGSVAPGGYAWVFPRSGGEANVGLGIMGTHSDSGQARAILKAFIDREFPGARTSELHCGGVPVAKWLRPLTRGGVMLVGDAARQVNCISGAGIAYALFAGKLAGRVAAEAFNGQAFDPVRLRLYEREWKKAFGKQQDRSYTLKEFLRKADDAFIDKVATSLAKENPQKLNYLRVFIRTFKGRPLLLLKAIKLFR